MAAATVLPLSPMRSARRYAHPVACRVDVAGLGRVDLECVNLSACGAFFEASVVPDEGTDVRCAIPLPGIGYWLVRGHVTRVSLGRHDGAPAGIAVAFENVTHDDRRRLRTVFGDA